MRFCRQGPSLVVHTPAKLNLFLEVRGRRPDGYHELETVMVSIDVFDTLRLRPNRTGTLSLKVDSDLAGQAVNLPRDDHNLVLQAARLLSKHCDTGAGATIELIKRIPVESGMGGGSSDAAATLVALNRLWQTDLSSEALHQLAAQLGSDVNFFLDSVTAARCCGRGEQIQSIPLPRRLHFVVIRPRTGLSTRDVFGRLGLRIGDNHSSGQEGAALQGALGRGAIAQIGQGLHNTLETPAREMSSDVARVLQHLATWPVMGSAMTGSGTACFALCRSARQARLLRARIRNHIEDYVWSVSSCI